MAIAIKPIPTLEGKAARDFEAASEKALRNAASVDFTAQVKAMNSILSKSKAK